MITAAITDQDLADALGVSRRRIGKWRTEGAPESLAWADWHRWLAATKRSALACRLADRAGLISPDTAPTTDASPGLPPIDPPSPDASVLEIDRHYRAVERQAKAEAAHMQAQLMRRELVRRADVEEAVQGLVGAIIEQLDQPWLNLQPLLVDLAPDMRAAARRAYLDGVRTARLGALRRLPTLLAKLGRPL